MYWRNIPSQVIQIQPVAFFVTPWQGCHTVSQTVTISLSVNVDSKHISFGEKEIQHLYTTVQPGERGHQWSLSFVAYWANYKPFCTNFRQNLGQIGTDRLGTYAWWFRSYAYWWVSYAETDKAGCGVPAELKMAQQRFLDPHFLFLWKIQ